MLVSKVLMLGKVSMHEQRMYMILYLQNRIMKIVLALATLCFQHLIKHIFNTFTYFVCFCGCARFVTISN